MDDRGEILIIIIFIGSGGPAAGLARAFHFLYPLSSAQDNFRRRQRDGL
jgi:hypothetical protein